MDVYVSKSFPCFLSNNYVNKRGARKRERHTEYQKDRQTESRKKKQKRDKQGNKETDRTKRKRRLCFSRGMDGFFLLVYI